MTLRKTKFNHSLLHLIALLLITTQSYSSNDSLLNVWSDSSTNPENRLEALASYAEILRSKHPDSCIQYLDKGIQLSKQAKLPEYFMKLLLIKRRIFSTRNEYDLSEEIYKSVIDIGKKEGKYKYVGLAHSYRAVDKFHQGLVNEAEEQFKASFKAFEKLKEPERSTQMGIGYMNYSTLYSNIGDFQKAVDITQKALLLLINDPYNKNVALGNLALFHQNLGNYDSALSYYYRIKLDTNRRIDIARNKFNMSSLLERSGQLDSALKFATEAYKLFATVDHKYGQAATLNGIASIYARRAKYNMSHEHLDRAIEICTSINLKTVLTTLYVNKGEYYSRQNLTDKANNSFLEALKLAKETGRKITIGEVYLGLGANSDKMENFEEAIKYYESAVEVFEETGEILKVCMSKRRAGYSYMNMGDVKGSILLFREALFLAKNLDNLEKVSYGLSEAYELDNQWDSAYKYAKKTLDLRDSLLVINDLELEKEVRAKFEIDYAEEKVLLTEKKLAAEEESRRLWNLLMISVIFIAVVTLIMLNRQLKLSKEKRKIVEMDLLQSKKEKKHRIELLRNQSASILDKNSLINNLKEQVKVIMQQAGISETPKNIDELMDRKVLTNGDWERFRIYFQAAYPEYFETINKQFPDMSKAEERLLCLYKFEISEEEMANTLAISKDSLQKTKRRFRNKYEIPSDEQLFEILNNF